ncbi:hypothetical protein M2163_000942 [Streptomyces sp. SAI-135]|uniref:hypothetical protein n=1 Tax=unclassified Streptomyces TaxID=2593676 RepID=UPI0024755699|nr:MULTISPECIES: hypothetical protein [unclassified Streptomyces]MDH6522547.1 hypothetical protein [Streptomyces sp. SAI-090]MDH6554171.1 hypothetical protein [Streptomyces sp. SAI-041]MDH6573432.1 hypothetical protein [Streptomyces sp. SAI-117]MDH6613834.1 hypothetical protein [Streptomyces sp. SAI-135]
MADHAPAAAAAAPVRTAIYINRRSVLRIEIPMAYTMAAHNDGWKITFDAPGKIRLLMNEGHNDQIDVKVGDYMLSSGEDMLLSLQQAAVAGGVG